jgi:hypothetical protein
MKKRAILIVLTLLPLAGCVAPYGYYDRGYYGGGYAGSYYGGGYRGGYGGGDAYYGYGRGGNYETHRNAPWADYDGGYDDD